MTDPKTVHVEPLPYSAEELDHQRAWHAARRAADPDHLRRCTECRAIATLDAARQPASPDLRAALVAGQKDAEAEHRKAQTGTEDEAYHNGRMVAYMDAVEAFDRSRGNPMSSEDRLRRTLVALTEADQRIPIGAFIGTINAALAPDDTTGEGPCVFEYPGRERCGWTADQHSYATGHDYIARASAKP